MDTPTPTPLTPDEIARYGRHLILPEVGLTGQQRLKEASVLLVGLGGLGAPAALYLTAAGVGRIGLMDSDTVARSNLQRQILYQDGDVGRLKVEAARDHLQALNPHVQFDLFPERLQGRLVAFEQRLVGEGRVEAQYPRGRRHLTAPPVGHHPVWPSTRVTL